MKRSKAAAGSEIEVGSPLKFLGYSQLADGDKPTFAKGDYLRVIEVNEPEGDEGRNFKVSRFVPKDNSKDPGYDSASPTELLYEDEVMLVDEDEADDGHVENSDGKANVQSPYVSAKAGKSDSAHKGSKKAGKKPAEPETETKHNADMKTLKVTKGSKKKAAAAPAKKAPVLGKGAKKTAAKKAAKPAKKKAALVPVVVLPPVEDTPSVKLAIKAAEGNALKAVENLEQQTQMSRWTLGGVLSKIKREKLFVKNGKTKYSDDQAGFEKFCEDNTNTGYRVAMILIGNFEHFSRVGADEKLCAAIPYHKLKEVVHVVTDEKSAEKWLGKAEELTREELVTQVRTQRLTDGTEVKKRGIRTTGNSLHRVTFALFNDHKELVLKAVEKAKKKMPPKAEGATISDGEALAHIAGEWIANCA